MINDVPWDLVNNKWLALDWINPWFRMVDENFVNHCLLALLQAIQWFIQSTHLNMLPFAAKSRWKLHASSWRKALLTSGWMRCQWLIADTARRHHCANLAIGEKVSK